MSNKTPINQKEYLRKYLGKDSNVKKKKKKKPGEAKNVKIIDDDLLDNEIDSVADLLDGNEYAPQIVAIVDERPPSMRIDELTRDNLWKPIGTAIEPPSTEKLTVNKFKLNKPAVSNIVNHYTQSRRAGNSQTKPSLKRTNISTDSSPPRKRRDSSDPSPPRRRRYSSDSSPPRKSKTEIASAQATTAQKKRTVSSPDPSPPRRRRRSSDSFPPTTRKSEDESRKSYSGNTKQNGSSSDQSPTRQGKYSSDSSPPRKRKSEGTSEKMKSGSSKQADSTPDQSPPRRRRLSSDLSPPRKRKLEDPPVKRKVENTKRPTTSDLSPPRRRRYSSDSSPPRKRKPDDVPEKMDKTLDGKRAGLQRASELVGELKQFKKREDELFNQLSAEDSGRNAESVLRDRKTGKIRDLHEEARQQQQKNEEENKRKQKYSRWGKGLKQVEDREKKIAENLHEMSKPLARFADDGDLETYLREQEHREDPMLGYLKQKKRSKALEEPNNYAGKPVYMGEFMPNRYGIPPGHRWDGVDRSNGYETKFFQVQNEREAQKEESYKWSTEDM